MTVSRMLRCYVCKGRLHPVDAVHVLPGDDNEAHPWCAAEAQTRLLAALDMLTPEEGEQQ